MLAEAVDALKGVSRPRMSEVTVDLPLAAFLPREYISRTSRRVEIYRRLAEAGDEEEVACLAEEVRDRYGPLPREVENLFGVARLRLLCIATGIREVAHEKDDVVLRLGRLGRERLGRLQEEAAGEGYPWVDLRYRKTLQELVLAFPRGSWALEGRRNLVQLLRFLGAIVERCLWNP